VITITIATTITITQHNQLLSHLLGLGARAVEEIVRRILPADDGLLTAGNSGQGGDLSWRQQSEP
jgi:hypothetical protein